MNLDETLKGVAEAYGCLGSFYEQVAAIIQLADKEWGAWTPEYVRARVKQDEDSTFGFTSPLGLEHASTWAPARPVAFWIPARYKNTGDARLRANEPPPAFAFAIFALAESDPRRKDRYCVLEAPELWSGVTRFEAPAGDSELLPSLLQKVWKVLEPGASTPRDGEWVSDAAITVPIKPAVRARVDWRCLPLSRIGDGASIGTELVEPLATRLELTRSR